MVLRKTAKKVKTKAKKKSARRISKTTKLSENFDYKKYRWFYTKSGILVYGGKNAEQNEEIVRDLIKEKKNYIMMHTKIAGSPFAVVREDPEKIVRKGLDEVAEWTASFSRAWRNGLKTVEVHVFLTEQMCKKPGMAKGSFCVIGKVDKVKAELKLALIKQNGVLRAVPLAATKGKKYSVIAPGKIPKEEFASGLSERLKLKKDEVLNALPTGSFMELTK